ncbi:MAG: homoserine dehydrogenase [Erysipelotrichia bacterium]|nr:homoserine dehydrogenase [Erysipelotrichia bacterium]
MMIGLLGYGVVGRGTADIIDAKLSAELQDISIKRILVKDLSEGNDPRLTTDPEEILEDDEIDVIVECMGGLEPAHTIAARALSKGKGLVTSNKKMYASFQQELQELAVSYGGCTAYEACVGGGIPWIHEIRHTRRIDEIVSFRGIFNGTTNYILSNMTDTGAEFDVMLKEAQKLGYAERDPSDDIDGFDVRYKVCISLASCFDVIVSPENIPVLGIRSIKAEDIAYARAHHKVIKLIGSGALNCGAVNAAVRPVMLDEKDLMSNVPGNFNHIELNSATLGRAGFFGQGAGSKPTAHAVVQDILDLSQNHSNAPFSVHFGEVRNEALSGRYYVRTVHPEALDTICAEKISAQSLITEKVSLNSFLNALKECKDEQIFAAEVTE